MVFLSITSDGLREALRFSENAKVAVWCGADAISETEYKALCYPLLSRFTYPLSGASADVLADTIDTIEEHHPNERVWVENVGHP